MRRFRERLLEWFRQRQRDLPWRRTKDPYRVWLSEVMLQQTRVAAVVPYYERFVERFPCVDTLARAQESDVLALWGGLGYYSRARNLFRAARRIRQRGKFPDCYDALLELPGVGEYTAAAVASIAFGEARAVVDGNVRRVLSRLRCGKEDPATLAGKLLDRQRPGDFNQALMELGSTVCLPKNPRCGECPVSAFCEAKRTNRQEEFPQKRPRRARERVEITLGVAQKNGRILVRERNGFWELPEVEELAGWEAERVVGEFRHSILHQDFRVKVVAGKVRRAPRGYCWRERSELKHLPVSTIARKALAILSEKERGRRALNQ